MKLCGSRGDADAAAADVDDGEEKGGRKKNTFQREIKRRRPRRGVLLRRGEAERLAASLTPHREKRREGGKGEGHRLHQSVVVTSAREGAKWKETHTHADPSLSSIPLSTAVQLHFFFSSHHHHHLLPLPSSAPVSARLRLGDKYGSWSRTQRPGAHFSLTFVRSTTNTTPKIDKNLQAIFSRRETIRRGRRCFQTREQLKER